MALLRQPIRARRTSVVTLMLAALIGTFLFMVPQALPASADASAGGGDFVSFATGARVLDTRNKIGVTTTTPMAAASQLAFPVLGVGSVPATGVSAVMVTVTALAPTASMLFRVWPDDGSGPPAVSVLHSVATRTISNTAVIPVAANGKIRIYNSAGTTHALIDVQGYFTSTTTTTGPGGFTPITQTRVVDSRSNLGTTGGSIAPGGSRTITLATAGVPATATAVYLNLTVPTATSNGTIGVAPGTAVTGGSLFNYVLGSSSSGMSVKLSGGKATFRNSAAAEAADIVVDIQGYFSPTSTVGGGYRSAVGRPLDTRTAGIPLAGGGQIDFQVGGAAGLPVRGVAAALLNIHTSNSNTDSAVLGAWPTGTARPGTSVNHNPGDSVSRANLNVIQPGTDGKVTIRNLSTVEVHVYVEIQGWFADPLAPVAIELNSSTSAIQATALPGDPTAPRALDFSYVDNSGQLKHGHVPDPDLPNNPNDNIIQTLSGGDAFTGTPAIAEQANGNLFIAGHHTESNVWAKTETNKAQVVWPDAWTKLGGSIISHTAVGTFSDNRLALFGVDPVGALWGTSQNAVNGAFGAWTKISAAGITGTPVVVRNPAGVLQVFARTLTGNIVTATYSTAGAVSGWASLGNPGAALDSTGTPAVAVGPTLIGVFVRTPAGEIATQQQIVGGTWSGTWTTIPGAAAGGRPTAVVHPANGTYQVFTRSTDGRFQWATEMTRNSGTWSTWASFFGDRDDSLLISDPTALSWVGSTTQKFGIVYRVGNDINVLSNLATTIPPPAAGGAQAKAKATTETQKAVSSEPEYHRYIAPKD